MTPNQLTSASLLLGTAAAGVFALGGWHWLVLGAVLFHFSFVFDCMDGKIARLKGTGTMFGLWLDYVVDRVRVALCSFGLAFGQYQMTGDVAYLLLGAGITVLDLFRYINGMRVFRVNEAIKNRTAEAMGKDRSAGPVFVTDILRESPEADPRKIAAETSMIDLQRGFHARFPWFNRFRIALVRRRVRSHVISGIEFHMAVFIVAPILGPSALIPIAGTIGAILMTFEFVIVYRLWLAARECERVIAKTRSRELLAVPEQRAAAGVR
ncbi:CDP-alcohol phosphatidyltransferase family protein [Rhizohabitans arisaemae]|uniref:CDP-alcohol phosphatidyltransferase family protein n=1 Tax=Rhizohabitans arisaemae TaxID=2720610 RepID=UPI0024B21688|nr:CDP-alcohol phosphatidyltransferase family protein [Rhizohabitans arisaemae]